MGRKRERGGAERREAGIEVTKLDGGGAVSRSVRSPVAVDRLLLPNKDPPGVKLSEGGGARGRG